MPEEYTLFLDDCGERTICKPEEKAFHGLNARCFALGGVIVERSQVADIEQKVEEFCKRWRVPFLHGNKIRGKKGAFSFLGRVDSERDQFFEDLNKLVADERLVVHGCIICRPGYRDRYWEKHENRWDMSKTAFDIVAERAAKFARNNGKKLSIVYERTGRKEDRKLETYYRDLKSSGMAFDKSNSSKYSPLSAVEFAETLAGINGEGKNNKLLQIADLVIHPICHRTLGKPNKAFEVLLERKRLIDFQSSEDEIALKYSCFDGPYNAWK